MPLVAGDQARGVIDLSDYERENAYSDSDVRLLQTLANSMSVALENARLFDETQRLLKETDARAAELAIINGVQQGLADKLEAQAIYELVGDKLRELFDSQAISIVSFDAERNNRHYHYLLERGQRFEMPDGPIAPLGWHLIRTGKPLLVNDNLVARLKRGGHRFEDLARHGADQVPGAGADPRGRARDRCDRPGQHGSRERVRRRRRALADVRWPEA